MTSGISHLSRHRTKVIWAMALLALGVAGVIWFSSRGPIYHGKNLEAWLETVGRTQFIMTGYPEKIQLYITVTPPTNCPPAEHIESLRAMRAMGTNALPFLQPSLVSADSSLRLRIEKLIARAPWLAKYFVTARERRERAMAAVLHMGDDAVPFLVNQFENEDTPVDLRIFAAHIFSQRPLDAKPALAALAKAKRSTNPILAQTAARAIQAIEQLPANAERPVDFGQMRF